MEHKHDETCEHNHSEPAPSYPQHSDHEQREMLELNVLEMQIRQLEQQSLLAEQQIVEQQSLILNLDDLKKAKKGQSMLFPFSKDIFVEGKLESSDVLVNIGSKTIVKKNIDETKKFAERQKQKLLEVNDEIRLEMRRIINRILEIEKKFS